MGRKYNIRWKPDDDAELKRVVRNFNDKIRRLEKKNPKEKNALPERVSVRQMKELIKTRDDLKRELKTLKNFSKKGAEEIVLVPGNQFNLKATKWQIDEMLKKTAYINKTREKRKKAMEKWEMSSGGVKTGYTIGEFGMGQADKVALEPLIPFTATQSRADFNMRFRHIKKERQSTYFNEKEERLRYNYIAGLQRTYNEDEISDIVKEIEDMEFHKFYKKFQEEGGTMEYASRLPNNAVRDSYVEHLHSTWLPNKSGSEK